MDARERLVHYLDDAWAVEKSLVTALRDMAKEVDDPDLRAMFEDHAGVTWQQEEALEARLRALGKEPSGMKGFFNQMMARMGDFMHAAHDQYDKQTTDLMKAYASEHLEIAMYESLGTYAQAIGDTVTADLAHQHQQQEKQAAEKIWRWIDVVATRTAAAATTARAA